MSTRSFLFQINVTRACNLRCSHCYIESERKSVVEQMNPATFLDVVAQIRDLMLTLASERRDIAEAEIHVIGGEPTLLGARFFDEAMPAARGILSAVPQRVSFSIVSNLLSPESAKIAEHFDFTTTSYEPRTRFVSWKGAARPGLERVWLERVRALRARQQDVNVTVTVTRPTCELGAEALLGRLLEGYGFERIHLGFFVPSGDGAIDSNAIAPSYAQASNFLVAAARWYLERREHAPGLYVSPVEAVIEAVCTGAVQGDLVCPMAAGSMDIDPNGDVRSCIESGGTLGAPHQGNLHTTAEGLRGIYRSGAFRRERLRAMRPAPACVGCPEFEICQGGCSVLHGFWDGEGECPGYRGFLGFMREQIRIRGLRPRRMPVGEGEFAVPRGCR